MSLKLIDEHSWTLFNLMLVILIVILIIMQNSSSKTMIRLLSDIPTSCTINLDLPKSTIPTQQKSNV